MYSNFKLWYNGCAYSLPTLTALNFWTSKSSCWWFVALWKSHAKTSVNVGGVPVRISNFHKRQQIIMKKTTLEKDTPYSFTNYPYFVCFSGLVVGGWFMDQRNPTKSDQADPPRSTLDKAQGSQRCRRHWRFASVRGNLFTYLWDEAGICWDMLIPIRTENGLSHKSQPWKKKIPVKIHQDSNADHLDWCHVSSSSVNLP